MSLYSWLVIFQVRLLCISTSFWVLRAPKSWLKHFFQPFSTFFLHFKLFSVYIRNEAQSIMTLHSLLTGLKPACFFRAAVPEQFSNFIHKIKNIMPVPAMGSLLVFRAVAPKQFSNFIRKILAKLKLSQLKPSRPVSQVVWWSTTPTAPKRKSSS